MPRRCMKLFHPPVVIAVCSLVAPLVSVAAPQPQVKDLGTLGGRFTVVSDINSLGQATGYSETSEGLIHAFLYANGAMQDLGTLGGTGSLANAINDPGQITGFALTAQGEAHAFLYAGGSMVDLGPAGTSSSGKAINRSGQVAGQATSSAGRTYALLYSRGGVTPFGQSLENSTSEAISALGQVAGTYQDGSGGSHAFLYSGQSIVDLRPGYSSFVSGTHSINASGSVTGAFKTGGTMHGFVYTNGGASDIGSLGGGYTVPTAINTSGSITGVSSGADGNQHAFLYSAGQLQDVGTLSGTFSVGNALNGSNQIVGQSMTSSGQLHAFIATQPGTLIDLGQLVAALAPGNVTDSVGVGINDLGQVIGHYTVSTPSDLQMPAQTRSFIAIVDASALFEDLLTLSARVGPGKSLESKAQQASGAYSAGDTTGSCSELKAYLNEVAAQDGKKIDDQTALLLDQKVATIMSAIGC